MQTVPVVPTVGPKAQCVLDHKRGALFLTSLRQNQLRN